MSHEKEIKEVVRRGKNGRKKQANTSHYPETGKPRDITQLFDHGTERELMQFLRASGLNDDSPRFAEIVKLFREHGGKRL